MSYLNNAPQLATSSVSVLSLAALKHIRSTPLVSNLDFTAPDMKLESLRRRFLFLNHNSNHDRHLENFTKEYLSYLQCANGHDYDENESYDKYQNCIC